MKPQLTILAISLALAGCGGSSGDTSAPTYTTAGKITAQNVNLESKVCSDLNQSFTCDAGEPTVTADSNGEFSLTSTQKSILSLPLLVEVDTGVAATRSDGSSSSVAYIAAPGIQKASGNEINGISSLIAGYMGDGFTLDQANAKLKAQLATKGITINGALEDQLSATELASLEQNVVSTLKLFDSSNRAYMLAQFSASFDDASADYVAGVLDANTVSTFVQNLEDEVKAGTTLNDTGATLYFSDTDNIQDVQDRPDSFPGQDAEYGFDKTEVNTNTGNGFKFVKLDLKGVALADDATEWSCVLDERSGLIWESKTEDAKSLQFKDRQLALEIPGVVTPYELDIAEATCQTQGDSICTTQDYVEHINSISLCGKTDWRLPTFHEFYNLLDFGETEKNEKGAVYGLTYKYFPHQTSGGNYTSIGAVWNQSIVYNQYSPSAVEGGFYYNEIGTLGGERGYISALEIYSGDVDSSENSDSYLFPARLVSVQGK
ncbi:DUF1566 domain-containing protein [Vibrio fortis]|uniref:DUF1566 domain-containing protein n=1 Tax=Vibrio fortis TaxID=212667 RepID=UPI0021C46DEF|nr:DUF1566 domain-containing protein [Vibrio fortis]